MEEEAEKSRDARLDAWGRDDFSVYKPKKVVQSTETVEMEVEITFPLYRATSDNNERPNLHIIMNTSMFYPRLPYSYFILFIFFQITTVKEVIDGTLPFFREKPRDVALSEGEPLELKCLVASEPKSAIHWLKNDLIFMDDSRLRVNTTEDGASTLTLDPAMPSDAGLYKGN